MTNLQRIQVISSCPLKKMPRTGRLGAGVPVKATLLETIIQTESKYRIGPVETIRTGDGQGFFGQAEIGCGAAMAAAALVQLQGGTVRQACDAASMALQCLSGLVCDPVAGTVQVPCIARNMSATATAFTCANAVMAGFDPVIYYKQGEDLEETIKTLDTRVDFRGNEMLQALKAQWAEALSMLGITAETAKKERMIERELVLNRQEAILSLNSRLLNRIDFCNRLKRNYGIECTVNVTSQDLEFKPFGGDYAMQALNATGADEGEATARENRED